MKKLLCLLLIGFVTSQAHAQFSKGTLQATGLTCAMCSNAINKALQGVTFVGSVDADIKNSAFNMVFKPGVPVNIDALKEAVEDAGFSIGSLSLTGTFNDVKIGDDRHVQIGAANFHFLDVKEQTLNGEKTIIVVDKNYVTAKQFKKISSSSKMACVQTGKTEACCTKGGLTAGSRVYHVTI